ncbi:MAG: lysophospholipid acyltransferase family protein [Legionellaceae bacterium]
MTDLTCPNDTSFSNASSSHAYTLLFMLTGLSVAVYAFARFAEANNQLNYNSRLSRIIAGCLNLTVNMLHTTAGDLSIVNDEAKLITSGPHLTSWEAFVLASKMKGTPPQIFATDMYNFIPGVASFMERFKVITIEANPVKQAGGPSGNAKALEKASQALKEKGCVALFPQGNFCKIAQDAPRVYNGAAKLAIMNQIPIHVIRLDGYWSLQNTLIPLFVRNHAYFRAFVSGFLRNNVRATLCCVIDFHLQPENNNLSEDEKIDEICAQLYAYYRHTEELSVEQINSIKTSISDKTHLMVWKNKVQQGALEKELATLKKEAAEQWGLSTLRA